MNTNKSGETSLLLIVFFLESDVFVYCLVTHYSTIDSVSGSNECVWDHSGLYMPCVSAYLGTSQLCTIFNKFIKVPETVPKKFKTAFIFISNKLFFTKLFFLFKVIFWFYFIKRFESMICHIESLIIGDTPLLFTTVISHTKTHWYWQDHTMYVDLQIIVNCCV